MYHVQTLCTKAVWIHHGAARMHGNSFDVTREYLTYHEERSAASKGSQRAPEGPYPRLTRVWIEDARGTAADTFQQGETLVLQAEVFDPDDRGPVLLFGVVRVDGTSIYGSHSNERGYVPARLGPKRFGFAVRFQALSLLPGKYHLRVHTLDAEGLRLFDTVDVDFIVRGETRDYGVVALPQAWARGRGVAAERAAAGP
jgi:lipopolysaccharide transport system ATP-binding protein